MKIPNWLGGVILLAVLAGVGVYAYHEINRGADPGSDPGGEAHDGRAFHTEEEWTALRIAQFLADFGALGRKEQLQTAAIRRLPSTGDEADYEVRWGGKKGVIAAGRGIWNPEAYTDWARAVLPKADATRPELDAVAAAGKVLNPSFDTFQAENRRISDFLNAHPASGAGHLQAAVLVGTIGLNDHAGKFRDTRIPLHRMTAHLAAADALGVSPADPARQLAEGIRLTLIGQEAEALKCVAAWPADPALDPWRAVLRFRNTGDWRVAEADPGSAPAAVVQARFDALCASLGPGAGVEFLRKASVEPDITLWRIANAYNLSVSEGHVFTKPILAFELKEITDAAERLGVTVSKDNLKWLTDYLDTPEGSPVVAGETGPRIDVAGKNLFAGYHQRHLMQAGAGLFAFLNDSWGVRDEAGQLAKFLETKLPDLRYKPFLLRMNARNDAARKERNVPCEQIIAAHPEWVTPTLWASLRRDKDDREILPAPDFHAWFRPEIPRGTAYHAGDRLWEIGVGDENDREWLRVLNARKPYDYGLSLFNARLESGEDARIPGDVAARWLGPQMDFSVFALKRVASAYEGQPQLYEEHMSRAVAWDPDLSILLGNYFAKRQDDEKAATWFLRAYREANDRVWMANNALWIVKHLAANGKGALATEIAEDAAEVYSHGGLSTHVWLMEHEGRWDRALETAARIDDRYNRGKPTSQTACLIRLSELSPEKAAAGGYQDTIFQIFPGGVQKAALADFAGPPTQGVRIDGDSPALVPFGLARNMVVVALNGYRTDTFDQYDVIRTLSDDPTMQLIVWDGARYRVSEGSLPGRRFRVDMVDHSEGPR